MVVVLQDGAPHGLRAVQQQQCAEGDVVIQLPLSFQDHREFACGTRRGGSEGVSSDWAASTHWMKVTNSEFSFELELHDFPTYSRSQGSRGGGAEGPKELPALEV